MSNDYPGPDPSHVVDAAVNPAGPVKDIIEQQTKAPYDPLDALQKAKDRGQIPPTVWMRAVASVYARLAEPYVVEPPPVRRQAPAPFLPGPTEDWDWGDDPSEIDWTATVLARGPLAPVMPLKRERLVDEPEPEQMAYPSCEIYVDTSGSMPNPAVAVNAMTLAAVVLATSCTRFQGDVRGIIYSSERPPPIVSPWTRSEEKAQQAVMPYLGGGTIFPFELMVALSKEKGPAKDAFRVVISDRDFLYNVRGDDPGFRHLQEAARRSRRIVLLLAANDREVKRVLGPLYTDPKFLILTVDNYGALKDAASKIAGSLFGIQGSLQGSRRRKG